MTLLLMLPWWRRLMRSRCVGARSCTAATSARAVGLLLAGALQLARAGGGGLGRVQSMPRRGDGAQGFGP
jgi:hypothetical protein